MTKEWERPTRRYADIRPLDESEEADTTNKTNDKNLPPDETADATNQTK